MDSTSSRPPDSIPTMDDHVFPIDNNLSHEQIFVARVSNILKAKRNAYKKRLLRELHHLRHIIVAATPDLSRTPLSQQSTLGHLLDSHPNSTRDHNSEHLFADETLDITSNALLSTHQLLPRSRYPSDHHLDHNPPPDSIAFSHSSSDHSTYQTHSDNINRVFSTPKSALDGQFPTDVASGEGQHRVEAHSHSPVTRPTQTSSIPQLATFKHLPAFNDILLSYRRLKEMREAYCSTPSPSVFATFTAGAFSSTAPSDPLQTNSRLNLTDPKAMRQARSYQFSTFPSSSIPMFQDGRNARTFRHRYVPPLLAKLFYEQEFSHLFDSNFRYTFSAQETSLNKASELYNRRLFPAPRTNSVLKPRSDGFSARVLEATAANDPVCSESNPRKEASVHHSQFSSRTELKLPLRNHSKFQLYTFHHSLISEERHRVPVAQWHHDLGQKKHVLHSEQRSRSHYAYAIPLNDRGLPHYTDSQGVSSGVTPQVSTTGALRFQSPTNYPFRKACSPQRKEDETYSEASGSTIRAFGFQSRTNYPFRRTYGLPRKEAIPSAPRNTPPRVSREFASRVPVGGLSTTLLHLFEPSTNRGLFFNKDHLDFSMSLEKHTTEVLYSICDEGRLVLESRDD